MSLTCLSCVTAGYPRTRLLVVDKPFLQAEHDPPAIPEGRLLPLSLRVRRTCDLVSNLIRAVRSDRIEVKTSSRVEASDPSSVLRPEAWSDLRVE